MPARKSSALPADTADREMIVSRVVNAPRAAVWKAWTDPHQVAQWWGPDGFTNTVYEMDVRAGGVWRYMMHGPNGVDYPNKVVYIEVVAPERLVYHHGSDGDVENDPHSFHVTVTFAETAGKTTVTLRSLFATAEQLEAVKKFGAVEGGKQTLARLDVFLSRLR